MSYKIRQMRREDVAQVVEIDKEAFPTQWPPTNYRNELQNHLARYIVVYQEKDLVTSGESPTGLLATIRRWFSGRDLHDALKEDYIVGFAGCWIMADENHITEIAVREYFRHQGIGLLMMIALIEIGIELKTNLATLEVRVSNTTAQKLYQKLDFEVVGLRKRYYNDNREDALIMTNSKINTPEFQLKMSQLKLNLTEQWGLTVFPAIEN